MSLSTFLAFQFWAGKFRRNQPRSIFMVKSFDLCKDFHPNEKEVEDVKVSTHGLNFLKVFSSNIALVGLFHPRFTSLALANLAFEDGAVASLEEDD